MKNRIKQIRKTLGYNQTDFGKRIGVKGNTIGNYEIGLRTPSDAVLLSICREFGINEVWLRTGEGEMFVKMSRDEEIAAFVGALLSKDSNDFKHRLIGALSRLDENGWSVLEQFANDLFEGQKKD